MIQHATSSPFHVKRLAPGHYVRPDGKRVEVLRELPGDAYHIVNHRGEHRALPGAAARAYLKPLTFPHKPPRQVQPQLEPDDPRGSMTVVVGLVAVFVVGLLGLAVWACAQLPKVEW